MDVTIPAYPSDERPTTLAAFRGIVGVDQFDDWLPDCVYYEDSRLNEVSTLTRIEGVLAAGRIGEVGALRIEIPRTSGKAVPAISLPLATRMCTHLVIGAMAPRLIPSLRRDKVYGFRYHRGATPFFDEPAVELSRVLNIVEQMPEREKREGIRVFDVVQFCCRARFAILEQILLKAGARPDETGFLQRVLDPGPEGLPAVDDSSGFLYNFYLTPVDEALFRRQVNFLRYRDEYFVFSDVAQKSLIAELSAVGLEARAVGEYRTVSSSELEGRATRENRESITQPAGTLHGREVVAYYASCAMCTDSYHMKYGAYTLEAAVNELGAAITASRDPVDGMRVLPLLRILNRHRRTGVLLRPPFSAATREFLKYRQALSSIRPALAKGLQQAIGSRTPWQMAWIPPLMSDLGPLTSDETSSLQAIVTAAKSGPGPVSQARLALARSSSLPPRSFWAEASPLASEYERRATLLGARYLANRGQSSAWQAASKRFKADQVCVDYLAASIREGHA